MTLPLVPSAAPGSDPATLIQTTLRDAPATPAGMDLPAGLLPDAGALRARLDATLAGEADARVVRAITVRALAEARIEGNAALAAAFRTAPRAARALIRAQAALTDTIVISALHVSMHHLHPLPNPTEGERIAVLAVGGYGRAEMAPHSDVDLLFLTPYKITPWAESVIESMLYILWDLKLKVGHASRTVRDSLRLAREDITIRTALLECRFLAGHAPLASELKEKLWTELFRSTATEFIEAKLRPQILNG